MIGTVILKQSNLEIDLAGANSDLLDPENNSSFAAHVRNFDPSDRHSIQTYKRFVGGYRLDGAAFELVDIREGIFVGYGSQSNLWLNMGDLVRLSRYVALGEILVEIRDHGGAKTISVTPSGASEVAAIPPSLPKESDFHSAEVPLPQSPFTNDTVVDWVNRYIVAYGDIDGSHHKMWLIDQIFRITHLTPMVITYAVWGPSVRYPNGHYEWRYQTGEPSILYREAVAEVCGQDGEWDEGIAP